MSVLVLWLAVLFQCAHAATPPTTNKDAPAKKKILPKAKKVKPVATRKKAKPAPAPTKPAADIPMVTEAASVWQGCLESPGLPGLASKLGMDESRLGGMLSEEGLLAGDGGKCVPYVAGTGGEGGVASAMFQRPEGDNGGSIVAVRKTADGVTVTPGACDCPEPIRRVLVVPSGDLNDSSNEVLALLPRNVRWQLDILVPHMLS